MLYVIVPVHNRAQVTRRFLLALAEQTFADFTLVLVDDGCTDDTVTIARGMVPANRLIVLTGDGQLWWAGALELAYLHITPVLTPIDQVLISNDDVHFDSDFLAAGAALLAEHPSACFQAIGTDSESGSVDRGTIADLQRLHFRPAQLGERPNCLSTRGLLMNARHFVRSGGFKPRYLPHYLSDYEFSIRLSRQGVDLLCDDRFCSTVNLNLTGVEQYGGIGLRDFWSRSFSNRAKFNPKHWTAFVLLVCSPSVVPMHLLRIWIGFCRALLTATAAGWRSRRNV